MLCLGSGRNLLTLMILRITFAVIFYATIQTVKHMNLLDFNIANT